jgi:dihydrofolate synthase/folylpolyglutamate synthase
VLGADLEPAALEVARRVAAERAAQIVQVSAAERPVPLLARGSFQQRNFALARAAAEAYLKDPSSRLHRERSGIGSDGEAHERAVREAAASTAVPGRLQVVEGEPLTVLDGAHNPHAIAALVESLPEVLLGRPTAVVLGVLEDKDAAGMLAALLGACERAWFTAPPSPRALSPAALQSLARQLSFDAVSCEPTPWRALAEARRWAAGRGGAVLATGSVYLVGDLLRGLRAGDSLSGQQPSSVAS